MQNKSNKLDKRTAKLLAQLTAERNAAAQCPQCAGYLGSCQYVKTGNHHGK